MKAKRKKKPNLQCLNIYTLILCIICTGSIIRHIVISDGVLIYPDATRLGGLHSSKTAQNRSGLTNPPKKEIYAYN